MPNQTKPSPRRIADLLARGMGRAERHLPALEAPLVDVLVAELDHAALVVRGQTALTAASDPAFHMPSQAEVYRRLHVEAELKERLADIDVEVWRTVTSEAFASMGVSFGVRNQLMEGALAQRGKLITQITEHHRRLVMRILDDVWREGLGAREASKALVERGGIATRARATMIARTELVSTMNGAGLATVRHGDLFKYKEWSAAAGASHPRHYPDATVDGQTVKLHAAFNIHGWPMEYPGDPSGPPEDVINCRCTLLYKDEL